MLHEWLNALHVIAGVLWIGGMMGMAMVFAVSGKSAANDASRAALLDYVRKWNRCVTSPAMLLLWIAGIWMIVSYGKFPHAWLLIKMVVVVLLSAIHGMLSGELRRRTTGLPTRDFAILRKASGIIVAAVVVIVVLAVIRPF
ncbi:CopD family protein [Rahnella inusitata]|uniref:CopD family protein n=1 Tax=Rahnella inusitata TaxID=58169 RepID=UPI0039BE5243